MISLNKRNKAILLLALVLFVMLPFEFTWGLSALEYMDFGRDPISAVLFYIFYFVVIVTAIAAGFNRYDITKLASFVSLIFSVILVIQTVEIVYIDRLFQVTTFGLAYVAITAGIFFLARKEEVTQS